MATREWLQVKTFFYQLERRGEIEGRVTTKTGACIRGDDQGRDTGSVAELIYRRRRNVVIEAAIIVPCNDDNRAAPVTASHNRIDQVGDVPHSARGIIGWIFAIGAIWHEPADLRQMSRLGIVVELIHADQV